MGRSLGGGPLASSPKEGGMLSFGTAKLLMRPGDLMHPRLGLSRW